MCPAILVQSIRAKSLKKRKDIVIKAVDKQRLLLFVPKSKKRKDTY